MGERHQPATASITGSGAYTVVMAVVSDKSGVFNLLLFHEVKKRTEQLPCLIARILHSESKSQKKQEVGK